MSVENAGTSIRDARLKAGLTQEQLAEGVCSVFSLSRIENGVAGVSPSTFQALMAHAGVVVEAYPVFANRTDFGCFYALKQVRFYLDSWQLQPAYDKLEEVEQMQWSENKFYYQEWLLLHCKLQFRSGCGDHRQIYDALMCAIHISRPDFNPADFRRLLLSLPEIELFTLLAQEALYLGKLEMCLEICTQINSYLTNSPMAFWEKDRLLAENAVVYAKYLIAVKDYENALKTADYHRHKMAQNLLTISLHELTFLTALGYYYTNHLDAAMEYFKATIISAHSIESRYATICLSYIKEHIPVTLPGLPLQFEIVPLTNFPLKKAIDTTSMGDGTYDLFSPDVFTFGRLIRELRTSQNISQASLCQGLCSKSKLSKIENGSLQPEVILAQTLLQRLGISDAIFTFYGTEKESALQELMLRLRTTRLNDPVRLCHLTEELEKLASTESKLYLQYTRFKQGSYEKSATTRIQLLQQALAITLPDLSFNCIQNYRLSCTEIAILNSLCSAHADNNPTVGIQYFYKLWDYYDNVFIEHLELKRFLPVTAGMLVRRLYSQKRFSEVFEFIKHISLPEMKDSLYFTGHIYLHYCQILGELTDLSQAEKYGYYAYYNNIILENSISADMLKNCLLQDFDIHLL